jgi:hypothetical protein
MAWSREVNKATTFSARSVLAFGDIHFEMLGNVAGFLRDRIGYVPPDRSGTAAVRAASATRSSDWEVCTLR